MFVDFYKENIGNSSMLDEARKRLVANTLTSPLVGDNKIVDLESTDMESKVRVQFTPSLFYTFFYLAENDIIAGVSAVDYIPLILCAKKTGKFVEGINFNILPNEMRAVMLDAIDKSFDNYYTGRGLNDAQAGELAINETFGDILLNDSKRIQFMKYFEAKTGVSIMSAYRKYNISHISKPRMIEYSDYKYIPLLIFEDAVRGIALNKLQNKVINR